LQLVAQQVQGTGVVDIADVFAPVCLLKSRTTQLSTFICAYRGGPLRSSRDRQGRAEYQPCQLVQLNRATARLLQRILLVCDYL
jgi:hypothetical protein